MCSARNTINNMKIREASRIFIRKKKKKKPLLLTISGKKNIVMWAITQKAKK